MSQIAIAAALTGGSIITLFSVLIILRLRTYARPGDAGPEASSFSMARYQPMARLLAEDDFAFLAAQPGFKPEIGRKLRSERRRIFRLYLRSIAQDFRRLHAEAREMVAASGAEHAGLVGLLMKQQLKFWQAMTAIELRLAVEWTGLSKIDARGLIEAVEAMRIDLARLSSPATAV